MHLDARHDRFDLNAPFRISRGVRTATEVITVTLTDGALTGRGEGVPYPRYGESIDSTLAEIEAVRSAIEAGAGRIDLLSRMKPGAARNAVDCALWDLETRRSGSAVADAIGAPAPTQLASALTIVIDVPDAMQAAAALVADAPLLKVKVDGHDPERQLRAARAGAPDSRMIVDPNES